MSQPLQFTLDAMIAAGRSGARVWEDALPVLAELAERDRPSEICYARAFRDMASAAVSSRSLSVEQMTRAVGFVESSLRLDAPEDFDSYVLFMEWDREPSERFYAPRRDVLVGHDVVGSLQDLADGKLDLLAISMPPRTGKSTLCIFYLTWCMGRHPLSANLMTGYSDKLTSGFFEEALSIIGDASTYRFAEVFPLAPLAGVSAEDESISLVREGRYPTLTCRSADGTLTGAVEVGPDGLLYLDDMVKNREEALSSARMDKLYSIYNNQLKDRTKEGARQLLVGTRWVVDDPIGRIAELRAGDPRCRFLSVPALDERGESNFVYAGGVGFSTAYYEDMRRSLESSGDEDSWWAKYMNEPYDVHGRLFEPSEMRTYDELPEGEPDAVFAACDTKNRGTDYAVEVVGFVYGEDHYIHRVVCDNGSPERVEPRLSALLVETGATIARFESNNAGGRIADDVARACAESGHAVDMRKAYSTANKETRILADSPWIKRRCLFRSEPPDADYRRFWSLLTSYSTCAKNAHDDAPDCMSMYKRLNDTARMASVEAFRRPV